MSRAQPGQFISLLIPLYVSMIIHTIFFFFAGFATFTEALVCTGDPTILGRLIALTKWLLLRSDRIILSMDIIPSNSMLIHKHPEVDGRGAL